MKTYIITKSDQPDYNKSDRHLKLMNIISDIEEVKIKAKSINDLMKKFEKWCLQKDEESYNKILGDKPCFNVWYSKLENRKYDQYYSYIAFNYKHCIKVVSE